jgi:excisionase family DNA binding protein
MGNDEFLSTSQVAERLGVSRQRALELITSGRLAAQKVGNSYIVRASDLESLELLKPGRPPKTPKVLQTEKASRKATKKGGRKG